MITIGQLNKKDAETMKAFWKAMYEHVGEPGMLNVGEPIKLNPHEYSKLLAEES